MSDYTPTTEQVRIKYSMDEKYCDEAIEAKWAAEFDRWLAAHDAEVRADEREQVIHRLIHGDNGAFMGFYTDEPSESGWIDGRIAELCRSIRSAAAREESNG